MIVAFCRTFVLQCTLCKATMLTSLFVCQQGVSDGYTHGASSFFAMYRFDFMLDQELRPYIMEVHISCHAVPCFAMLRYAMSCCAMLCHAVPCCAMLCHAASCCVMPGHAAPCCSMLCHAVSCCGVVLVSVSYCAMLCHAALPCAVLCHAVLCCVMLRHGAPHCVVL